MKRMNGAKPSRNPFLIQIRPIGVGTSEVESLSGYLRRIADANHLPLKPFLRLAHPHATTAHPSLGGREIDVYPGDLGFLSHLTGQPEHVLRRLTCEPIMKAFYGVTASCSSYAAAAFVRPSYALPSFEIKRQFCPLCLRENFYFRLMWQLHEFTICPKHRIYLNNRCSGCHTEFALLQGGPVTDRCLKCGESLYRGPLTAAPNLSAPLQSRLDDYKALLEGRIHFGSMSNFVARINRYISSANRSWFSVQQAAGMSAGTIQVLKAGSSRIVALSSLMALAEGVAGSMRAFVQLPTQAGMVNRRVRYSSRFTCHNPWCPNFDKNDVVLYSADKYVCKRCGCRFTKAKGLIKGLPERDFCLKLHDFLHRLPSGTTWTTAYKRSGFPDHMKQGFMHYLQHFGVVERNGKTWFPAKPPQLDGFVTTPLTNLFKMRHKKRGGPAFNGLGERIRAALGVLQRSQDKITYRSLALQAGTSLQSLKNYIINQDPTLGKTLKIAQRKWREKECAQRISSSQIRKAINSLIQANIKISLQALAREINYSTTAIRANQPLYRRLKTVVLRTAAKQQELRRTLKRREIEGAIRTVKERGAEPTLTVIGNEIGKVIHQHRELYAAWRQISGRNRVSTRDRLSEGLGGITSPRITIPTATNIARN